MHIDSTPPTASPLLVPSPFDFSNHIPSSPHDEHNTIDILPSHHYPLPGALTSLTAGPFESLPLAQMDSVPSPAVGVAPSATAAADQIIYSLSATQTSFLGDNNPITSADVLPLLRPPLFLMI